MEMPKRWWTRRGSNPRPRRCERRALPTELLARKLSCLFNILVQHGSRIYQAKQHPCAAEAKIHVVYHQAFWNQVTAALFQSCRDLRTRPSWHRIFPCGSHPRPAYEWDRRMKVNKQTAAPNSLFCADRGRLVPSFEQSSGGHSRIFRTIAAARPGRECQGHAGAHSSAGRAVQAHVAESE